MDAETKLIKMEQMEKFKGNNRLHYKRYAILVDEKSEYFFYSKKNVMDFINEKMKDIFNGDETTIKIRYRTLKEVTGNTANEIDFKLKNKEAKNGTD